MESDIPQKLFVRIEGSPQSGGVNTDGCRDVDDLIKAMIKEHLVDENVKPNWVLVHREEGVPSYPPDSNLTDVMEDVWKRTRELGRTKPIPLFVKIWSELAPPVAPPGAPVHPPPPRFSHETLCSLLQPFNQAPTTAAELEVLLQTDLPCKLPTLDPSQITEETERYISVTQMGPLPLTITNILGTVFRSNVERRGEGLLHHPIDTLIVDLVTVFLDASCLTEIEIARDKKDRGQTTTGKLRPDFLLFLKDVLVLKGEEKGPSDQYRIARDELAGKFNTLDPLSFGKIRYLMCYAAAGTYVGFHAVDGNPPDKANQLIDISPKFNLSYPIQRILAVRCFINILRVFVTISDILPKSPIPLGKIFTYGNGTTIRIDEDGVVKTVKPEMLPYAANMDERCEFLKNVYHQAEGSTGLVQVDEKFSPSVTRSRIYRVKVKTRGLPISIQNENELVELAKCILTGLDRFHTGNFVHRDIRRPNIIYVPGSDNSPYCLVDFEHSGYDGETITNPLEHWDDNTLENGKYTAKSDLYEFGKLLRTFPTIQGSDSMSDLALGLLNKRYTAREALGRYWQTN